MGPPAIRQQWSAPYTQMIHNERTGSQIVGMNASHGDSIFPSKGPATAEVCDLERSRALRWEDGRHCLARIPSLLYGGRQRSHCFISGHLPNWPPLVLALDPLKSMLLVDQIHVIGNEICVKTARFANILSQIRRRRVIFTHLKLWIAVARHNFK